jgi:pyruvate carboxylase
MFSKLLVPNRGEIAVRAFRAAYVDLHNPPPAGSRQLLREVGPDEFARRLRAQVGVAVTDTTFRDAHQSLLATRIRTRGLSGVAGAGRRRRPAPRPGDRLRRGRWQA